MVNLSKPMRDYLRKKKLDPDIKGRSTTVKALNKRKLCLGDGTLTQMGDLTAISLLPLSKQCLFMNIPLEELALQYSSSPEIAVLDHLASLSKLAYFTENTFGVHIAQFFMFKYQYDIAIKNELNLYSVDFTANDCSRAFIYDELLNNLDEKLAKVDYKTIEENYYLIQKLNKQHYDNTANVTSGDENGQFVMTFFFQGVWNIEFYRNLYSVLGEQFIHKFIKFIMYNPYRYATGWPDILVLDEKPYFIEVKTTDRFNLSQINTMSDVMQKLGTPIKCIRVKNSGPANRGITGKDFKKEGDSNTPKVYSECRDCGARFLGALILKTEKGKYYRCPECKSEDIFLDIAGPFARAEFTLEDDE